MPALNPYLEAQPRQQNYGRYRPDLNATVSGPMGSSSGKPAAVQAMAQEQATQQAQSAQTAQFLNATRQAQSDQFQRDQQQSVGAYRAARDNSQGALAARQTRQEAASLGIDPSSDAKTVAEAASGPYRVGADGRIAGADSGNETVQPNGADVTNAVVNQQAAKDGTQQATQANFYANAAQAATGVQPTGATPFASVQPRATAAPALRPPDAAGLNPPATAPLAAVPPGGGFPPLSQQSLPNPAALAARVAPPRQSAMPSAINSSFNGGVRRKPTAQQPLVTP